MALERWYGRFRPAQRFHSPRAKTAETRCGEFDRRHGTVGEQTSGSKKPYDRGTGTRRKIFSVASRRGDFERGRRCVQGGVANVRTIAPYPGIGWRGGELARWGKFTSLSLQGPQGGGNEGANGGLARHGAWPGRVELQQEMGVCVCLAWLDDNQRLGLALKDPPVGTMYFAAPEQPIPFLACGCSLRHDLVPSAAVCREPENRRAILKDWRGSRHMKEGV